MKNRFEFVSFIGNVFFFSGSAAGFVMFRTYSSDGFGSSITIRTQVHCMTKRTVDGKEKMPECVRSLAV